MTRQNITENIKADLNLLQLNGVELTNIYLNSTFIHCKCRLDLRTACKKYKIFYLYIKHLGLAVLQPPFP